MQCLVRGMLFDGMAIDRRDIGVGITKGVVDLIDYAEQFTISFITEVQGNRIELIAQNSRLADQYDIINSGNACRFKLLPGPFQQGRPIPGAEVFFVKTEEADPIDLKMTASLIRFLEAAKIDADHGDRISESMFKGLEPRMRR